MRIVLASGSPRRRELLRKITENFEVLTADVDEASIEKRLEHMRDYRNEAELAVRTVRELSRSKAMAVFDLLGQPSETLVIGADTVVALENEILGKPKDREDAVRMLRAQSLEPQKVITGVTLILKSSRVRDACGRCCGAAGGCSIQDIDIFCSDRVCPKTIVPVSMEPSVMIRTFTEETLVYFKTLDDAQKERIQRYCDTDEPYDKAGAYGIQLNGSSLVDHYEGDYDNIVGFPTDRVRNEISALTDI